MSERLRAGTVWVNTYRAVSFMSPFGGYKRSGVGRENGKDAIYEYLQQKSVWISTATEVPNPFVLRWQGGRLSNSANPAGIARDLWMSQPG